MPLFTPPVLTGSASQVPRVLADSSTIERRLYSRVRSVDSSQSVIRRPDGTWETVTNPSQDEIGVALAHYQGGRTYNVSDAEASSLTAAGYGAFLVAQSGHPGATNFPAVNLFPIGA